MSHFLAATVPVVYRDMKAIAVRVFASMFALQLALVRETEADHGPGASAAGVSTLTAATLEPRSFVFELREDFTEFEDPSEDSIRAKAARAGSIDLLERSFLTGASISYGIVDDLQVGLSIPYYAAVNARDAEFDPDTGDVEEATFDPDGIGDLWLTGKYRPYRGPLGQVALVAGAKFPTGRSHVDNSAGERVEPSFTAGSGSWDGSIAVAYSRFLTSRITLDASIQYTMRGSDGGFRIGNRVDAGLTTAYRFDIGPPSFPAVTAILESSVRSLAKSQEGGVSDDDTGGTLLFLAPGIRLAVSPRLSFLVSTPIPVLQSLNGEQLAMTFKVGAGLVYEFDR